jgi:hypothetical protein
MRKIGRTGGAVGALRTMAIHGVDWGTGKIETCNGLSTPANADAAGRVLVRYGYDRPETLRSSDGGPEPSSGPKWSLHELVPLEVSPCGSIVRRRYS